MDTKTKQFRKVDLDSYFTPRSCTRQASFKPDDSGFALLSDDEIWSYRQQQNGFSRETIFQAEPGQYFLKAEFLNQHQLLIFSITGCEQDDLRECEILASRSKGPQSMRWSIALFDTSNAAEIWQIDFTDPVRAYLRAKAVSPVPTDELEYMTMPTLADDIQITADRRTNLAAIKIAKEHYLIDARNGFNFGLVVDEDEVQQTGASTADQPGFNAYALD